MSLSYKISDTPGVFVDWEALENLVAVCRQPGRRIALIGFNEYSKHLLNLCPENIRAIYDDTAWKIGITYKGITVSPPTETHDIDFIAVCAYRLAYDLTGTVRRLHGNPPWYIPPRFAHRMTEHLNVFEQEGLYRAVTDAAHTNPIPLSMMSPEKLRLLMELFRTGLRKPGNVVEMGVWQGGSCWHMAQILRLLGETRKVYLLDLFEQHAVDPTATMCTDQIRRLLAFYPHCTLLEGYVDEDRLLAQIEGPLCFAHFDLGFVPKALDFLWERLQPGSPLLLDNYGHIQVNPWDFDDFFTKRDARVIRLPWSEQGIVFKPTPT